MKAQRILSLIFLIGLLFGCSGDEPSPSDLSEIYSVEGSFIYEVEYSTEQKYYVAINNHIESNYEIVAIENGSSRSLAKGDGEINGFVLSDDNESIYYGNRRSNGGLYLQSLRLSDGFYKSLIKLEDAVRIYGLRKLSGGGLIFSVSSPDENGNGRILRYDFSAGLSEIVRRGRNFRLIDIDETNNVILAQDSFDSIVIMDLEGNNEKVYGKDTVQIRGIEISPDGKGIIGQEIFNPRSDDPKPTYQGTIYYDLETDKKTRLSEEFEELWPIKYVDNGSKVIAIAREGETSEQDEFVLWDLTTGEKKYLTNNGTYEEFKGILQTEPKTILFTISSIEKSTLYRVGLE